MILDSEPNKEAQVRPWIIGSTPGLTVTGTPGYDCYK